MAKKGTSPWLYIGCGCFTLAGLAVAAVIAAGIFGVSVATNYVEDLKDPESRTQHARAILRAEDLPAGYHALIFFKVPWFLDAVVLTDAPPERLGEGQLEEFSPLDSRYLGEHLFMYLALRGGDADIRSVFKGRGRSGEVDFDFGSSFDSDEVLSEGGFDLDGGQLTYTVHRGELTTEDHERLRGIYSEMSVDCRGDDKGRLAVWFARDPEGSDPETPPDLPGTPGDESAMRAFMGHFRLCAG